MSLMCRPVEVTLASLTASTISDSSTLWGYAAAAAVNATYLDPVTRRLFKARTAGTNVTPSFNASTDVVTTSGAHGRAAGDVFSFTGGTAPTGLAPATPYYIINVDSTTTFQISLTPDGDPINFSTNGTGTFSGYINGAFDNPEDWQDRGPPNRYRAFDQSNTTLSSFTTSCAMVIALSSRIDTVGLLAMDNVSESYIAVTGTTPTSRTNRALYSQDFQNAAWTKTNLPITADAARAIDGTMTADKLTPNTTSSVHTASQSVTMSGASVLSVYLKAAGYTKATVSFDTGSGFSATATVDLVAKTVTSSTTGGWVATVDAEWFADGTARVWVSTSAATVNIVIGVLNAAGASTFAGNGTSGIYAWGVQPESGTEPTPYIPTTSSTVTTTSGSHFEYIALTDTSLTYRFASIYNPTRYRRYVAVSTIPPWSSQSATITLISPGTGTFGNIVPALSTDIGSAIYSSRVGMRSASELTPDPFNGITPIIRPSAKRGNWTVTLPEIGSDAIKEFIETADGIPHLLLMAPDSEDSGFQWKQRGIIYGLAKNADFEFLAPSHDKYSLETEGYA